MCVERSLPPCLLHSIKIMVLRGLLVCFVMPTVLGIHWHLRDNKRREQARDEAWRAWLEEGEQAQGRPTTGVIVVDPAAPDSALPAASTCTACCSRSASCDQRAQQSKASGDSPSALLLRMDRMIDFNQNPRARAGVPSDGAHALKLNQIPARALHQGVSVKKRMMLKRRRM